MRLNMNFLNNFIKNKNVAFYIACGIAVAGLVVAIAYAATWIKGYESALALILLIVGSFAFVGLSFVNENIGAAVMAGCDLIAFAVYTGKTYSYITTNFATGVDFSDATVVKIIIFAVLMFLLFVAANVSVYMKMKKQTVGVEE